MCLDGDVCDVGGDTRGSDILEPPAMEATLKDGWVAKGVLEELGYWKVQVHSFQVLVLKSGFEIWVCTVSLFI